MSHASGRRRYCHQGVYFPNSSGLHGALIDLGQLTLCLEALLSQRGLLDAELVPRRDRATPPLPAISVRQAMEALSSAHDVLAKAAAVVDRVDQAIEQCGVMFDAARVVDDEQEQQRRWAVVFNVLVNVAADTCPVPRAQTAAARQTVRQSHQKKKARHSGA